MAAVRLKRDTCLSTETIPSSTLWTDTMHTTRQFTNFVVFLAGLIVMIGTMPAGAADGPEASPEKEKELLAILRSDAPASEKAITCKRLAIHGSSASVPDLAPLLHDAQLSSWARIALEAIPGTAADEALRTATRLPTQ